MAGEVDKLKGKVKEVAGKAVDDQSMENEGKLDQAKGHLKSAGENLKERAKEALSKPAEKAKEASEEAEQKTRRDPEES
ncbi:MAG TPA: CsbD family protein [Myxococcaceae bacterium]|nr:CsbD family protein [Myxococcaceae bacterium]